MEVPPKIIPNMHFPQTVEFEMVSIRKILFRFALVCLLVSLSTLCSLSTLNAADDGKQGVARFARDIQPLVKKYCLGCHGPKTQEADLRLDELDPDLINGIDAERWHEVLNQVNEGAMPPEDEPQLVKAELESLTNWLEKELHSAAVHRNSTGGRQVMRRMSRYEYRYTMQDVLGVALDYSVNIPEDRTGEDGLKTNAQLLGMSMVQMQSYLDAAEAALEEAIPDGPEKILKATSSKLSLSPPRRVKVPKGAKQSRFIAPAPGFNKSASVHDVSRKVTFNERPFAGRFRIRVNYKATASSDGRKPEIALQIGHRSSGDYIPRKVMGVKTVEACDEPQSVDFVGNIEDFPLGKENAHYGGSGSHNLTHLNVWITNSTLPKTPISAKAKIEDLDEPLIEVLSVEFEGPLLEGYPSETARDLLPDSLNKDNENVYAEEVLAAFMRRAYRRPITPEELKHATETFRQFRELLPDFKAAIRKTMAMVLISPKFIYLVEPNEESSDARELNDFELATRLSYFMWASTPDEELLSLADVGELRRPAVLKAQVKRLYQDEKFARFTAHFSEQWLGLSAMDNVAVNPSVYPQFSDQIKDNLREESIAFATHIFRNDLNCQNFIRSDFAVLNQITARHYGIEGVFGSHFRPVPLQSDDHRGGVLTQGSFMIGGSDGAESNPIYRGVWLRKRLFADPPPPPPPGAPPLDTENTELAKLTLKEQIGLHRAAPACARCHDKIDPWGVAFENFDATGRWRTIVEKTEGKKKVSSHPVDAKSTLPDGSEVVGVGGLQEYLIKNKSGELAEALSRRMLGYALGRQLQFSDDETVAELTRVFQGGEYRVSRLLEGIVTSRAFLRKN